MSQSVISTRTRVGGVVMVACAVMLSLAFVLRDKGDRSEGGVPDTQSDAESLEAVARTPVFFGHQSVGANILGGVPAVYASAGQQSPVIVESSLAPDIESGFAHAYIGENGDPIGKMSDFKEMLRAGYGEWARFALMKLCYVDVVASTDVDAVFSEYRSTMSQLEDEFPDVNFLYLTVPLTTEPGLKAKLKLALGRGQDDRADNVAREKYNALIRAEYGGTGRLVDVAKMESTQPDGSQVSGAVDGAPYFALYDGYASDPGHLNDVGAQVAAAGLLNVMGASLND